MIKCPVCKSMVDEDKPLCMSVVECNETRWKKERRAYVTAKDAQGYMWGLLDTCCFSPEV